MELKEYLEKFKNIVTTAQMRKSDLNSLLQIIEILSESNEFYGDVRNWYNVGRMNRDVFVRNDWDETKHATADDILNVSGAKAREAKEKVKQIVEAT